jgi:Rieske Fe-S protein
LVEPHGPDSQPHAPPPSLWPVGFAIGIAVLLTGFILDWLVAGIGAALTLVFGWLWLRDVTGGAEALGEAEPPPPVGARPATEPGEIERFPRNKFLEASTLGLGGLIGGLITVPVTWVAIAPTFFDQDQPDVDIGPLDGFPQDEWRVVTFMENPDLGEVTRRTVFVRYNGELEGQPSLTIISNRCAHLGCPVQPAGPIRDEEAVTEETSNTVVTRIPTNPAGGFACPCHGGAYDQEGDRTAGPPVRALDRYEYALRDGRVFLLDSYSVGKVEGEKAEAMLTKYRLMSPGLHVDGWSQLLYPIGPRR